MVAAEAVVVETGGVAAVAEAAEGGIEHPHRSSASSGWWAATRGRSTMLGSRMDSSRDRARCRHSARCPSRCAHSPGRTIAGQNSSCSRPRLQGRADGRRRPRQPSATSCHSRRQCPTPLRGRSPLDPRKLRGHLRAVGHPPQRDVQAVPMATSVGWDVGQAAQVVVARLGPMCRNRRDRTWADAGVCRGRSWWRLRRTSTRMRRW